MSKFEKILFKSGDKILFHTRGFSPFSMGIRFLTKSFWNHVGQYEKEVDSKGYIIEALGKGVVKTPIEKYINNKSYILKAVRLRGDAFKDLEEYKKGLQTSRERMYDKIGKKYDWWAIVFLGCKYIFKGYLKKVHINIWQNRERFFCSELICLNDGLISSINPYLYEGKTNQRCGSTTPKDIGKARTVKYVTGTDRL